MKTLQEINTEFVATAMSAADTSGIALSDIQKALVAMLDLKNKGYVIRDIFTHRGVLFIQYKTELCIRISDIGLRYLVGLHPREHKTFN